MEGNTSYAQNLSFIQKGNFTNDGNISYINPHLNSVLTLDYIYVTVVIVILLVCGVIGNAIVIKIYCFSIKVDPLSGRAFIPALAVVDLLSCIAGSIIYLVQNLQAASFSGDALCKFYYVLAYSCTMGASLMLVIISIHRHRKVCTPFKKQFPVQVVKFSPLVAGVAGLVLTLPMIPIVGEYKYKQIFYQEYGQKCTVLYHTDMEIYFWIYFIIIASIFFATCIVISVMSFLIHRTIKRQIQFRKSSTSSRTETSFSSSPLPHPSNAEESDSHSELQSIKTPLSVKDGAKGTMNGSLKRVSSKLRPKREKREYAIMFLAISVVYVITWLPTLA
ncbi:cholecystokinin receptor type A-like, partial [Saccostrea cucullata]|uniref:cholecystokinin receptor type A-like n=1 Tax=Saccostrea cuccullata TaxID=36930 RepID=UPI002ED00455